MERFITFCVLIFHSSLVASIPFPEEYNLAYQQPQLQFSAQPQAEIEPTRQQYNYGNYENFQPTPPSYGNAASYQNLYYPSHPNFREPAFQQGQPYNYFLQRPPIVPTQQQIQEEIQKKYQEQGIVNQLRIRNSQNVQNHAFPQSYYNPVPVYQQGSQIYVSPEQQLPLVNSPRKQFFSGQIQGNDKIAAALAAVQAAQDQARALQSQATAQAQAAQIQAQRQAQAAQAESKKLQAQALQNKATQDTTTSPQPVNPYQQIYDHVANNLPTGQNPRPIQWRNLWKQYAANIAPPKSKKRYLVIHPDGRTEYVDQIETIAKKHPNYLLVNGGSIPPGSVLPQSIASGPSNQAAVLPSNAAPQANDVSFAPVSPDSVNAPRPQDSSLSNTVTVNSDTKDQILPNTETATGKTPANADTNKTPLPSDPVPEPTPEISNLLPNKLTEAPSPDSDVVSTQTTSSSPDDKLTPASLPSDATTPVVENPSEPLKSGQNLEKSDPVPEPTPENSNLSPNKLTEAPSPNSDVVSTQITSSSPDDKHTPASSPSDATTPVVENRSEPLTSRENLEKSVDQPNAASSVPEEAASTPAETKAVTPEIDPEGTSTPAESKAVTPSIDPEGTSTPAESKAVTPTIDPTFVEPSKEDDDLDLSKLNTVKPPTIFLTSDSDILRELLGDDEISIVYFFQIKPKENTKTTLDNPEEF